MLKFYGEEWGGYFRVCGAKTKGGRRLIECVREDGRGSYCITISRWIMERRLGRIVPA